MLQVYIDRIKNLYNQSIANKDQQALEHLNELILLRVNFSFFLSFFLEIFSSQEKIRSDLLIVGKRNPLVEICLCM